MEFEYAIVEDEAQIGDGTRMWEFSKIDKTAIIGDDCVIGQNCYIAGTLGNKTHIQNNVSVYAGIEIGDECFIGNNVSFSNVNIPRVWRPIDPAQYKKTVICHGVTIEPNATIAPGVTIGRSAIIGHGSVVVEDVPPETMVNGNPAKVSLRSLNNKIKMHEEKRKKASQDFVRNSDV